MCALGAHTFHTLSLSLSRFSRDNIPQVCRHFEEEEEKTLSLFKGQTLINIEEDDEYTIKVGVGDTWSLITRARRARNKARFICIHYCLV